MIFFCQWVLQSYCELHFIQPTAAEIDGNVVYKYTQNNAALFGGEMGIHLHPHPLDWLHITSSYEMVIGQQKGI